MTITPIDSAKSMRFTISYTVSTYNRGIGISIELSQQLDCCDKLIAYLGYGDFQMSLSPHDYNEPRKRLFGLKDS